MEGFDGWKDIERQRLEALHQMIDQSRKMESFAKMLSTHVLVTLVLITNVYSQSQTESQSGINLQSESESSQSESEESEECQTTMPKCMLRSELLFDFPQILQDCKSTGNCVCLTGLNIIYIEHPPYSFYKRTRNESAGLLKGISVSVTNIA